jgi:hypothetical protein
MIKKVLLTTAIVAGFASSAAADCLPKVTLGGYLDTQVGFRDQRSRWKYEDGSQFSTDFYSTGNRRNDYAIVNDTKLMLGIDGKSDMGFGYGGKIVLFSDTSKAKEEFSKRAYFDGERSDSSRFENAAQVMMFLEGMFGRFEGGNHHGASAAMQVDAASLARATGGVDGDARYWWHERAHSSQYTSNVFLETPNLPTNEIGRYGITGKNAAKVTYYTPNFNGFTAGVSFIPDLQSHGSIANQAPVTKTLSSSSTSGGWPFKNIWEGGLHYEGMADQFSIKAALLGQLGESKHLNNAGVHTDANKDLKAWEAGINVGFSGITLGASYGSWGKSGTVTTEGSKGTHYWTLGGAYEFNQFGASLTYFNSRNGFGTSGDAANQYSKANKLETLSFGVDYKLAPGLLPYAEVTGFKFKDYGTQSNGASHEGNKGTIVLVGSKLSF